MKTYKQFINEDKNSFEEASEIFIEISSEEELLELKTIVNGINGYNWPTDCEPENVYVYPYYLFFNLNEKTIQWSSHRDMKNLLDKISVDRTFNGVLDKMFTFKDLNHFIMMLKTNKITNGLPDYSPKKKLLEDKNSFEEADEIMIKINNLDELNLLYDNIKPLGFKMMNAFFTLMKSAESPINLFINLKTRKISQTTFGDNIKKNFKNLSLLNGVWERELTITDLPYIIRILSAGRIIEERPSYKSKKFDKEI